MDDPFAILGLPRTFATSPQALQRAYLEQIAQLHPDKHADDPFDDEADQASARLNHAKQALEHHETRANILLALLGGTTKEQDKSLPEGFLMEMIDIREQVEADLAPPADTTPSSTAQPGTRAHWTAWALAQRENYTRQAHALFQTVQAAPLDQRQAHLRALRQHLNAWRYIERLLDQLSPAPSP